MDVRGFDPSIILISMGGILMSVGNSLEIVSQAILVGRFLVGRSGVPFGAGQMFGLDQRPLPDALPAEQQDRLVGHAGLGLHFPQDSFYVYIYIYIYMYTHTHTHVNIHLHIMCNGIYIYIYIYTYIHTYTHIYITFVLHINSDKHTRFDVYCNIHIYIYMYIYIYI